MTILPVGTGPASPVISPSMSVSAASREQSRNNIPVSMVAEERKLSGSSIPDGSRRSAKSGFYFRTVTKPVLRGSGCYRNRPAESGEIRARIRACDRSQGPPRSLRTGRRRPLRLRQLAARRCRFCHTRRRHECPRDVRRPQQAEPGRLFAQTVVPVAEGVEGLVDDVPAPYPAAVAPGHGGDVCIEQATRRLLVRHSREPIGQGLVILNRYLTQKRNFASSNRSLEIEVKFVFVTLNDRTN